MACVLRPLRPALKAEIPDVTCRIIDVEEIRKLIRILIRLMVYGPVRYTKKKPLSMIYDSFIYSCIHSFSVTVLS